MACMWCRLVAQWWSFASAFSGGDHCIHCWWDLIRSKQLSSFSVRQAQVFVRFSGHSKSVFIHVYSLKLTSSTFLWGKGEGEAYFNLLLFFSFHICGMTVKLSQIACNSLSCEAIGYTKNFEKVLSIHFFFFCEILKYKRIKNTAQC